MKLLMLSNVDILNESSMGVLNKLFGQANAFKSYGIDVSFIYNKLHIVIADSLCNNEKIKIRPSSTKDYYNKILKLIKMDRYDVVYIRYPLSEYYFINFLDSLKKINNKIKIIIDFPTYPYEQELSDNDKLNVDKYFRKYLHKFVDFGVCYNDVDSIFSIPVFNIGNGIDVDNISVKKHQNFDERKLEIIAVANLSIWHGYDRLLLGLVKYYEEKHDLGVHFSVVGVGSQLSNLRYIVYKYDLEQYVTFHGIKRDEELNELFNKSQVAIGSLGMHRTGLKDGATLKAREYCTRGIPFVLGYDDLDFQSEFKYILKVANDDTPIDINHIIEFYHKVYKDKNLAANMRKYAEDNLTWKVKLKPIISELMK